jgi:uncharacterized protein YcaQ
MNHFLLHRAKKQNVVDVAGAVCGLHSQLPLTPYYSLWNRIEAFKPELLEEALYKAKSLVKTWFVRGTLHIIPSKDLPTYHHTLKRMWFEHHGRYMNKPDWPNRETRQRLIYPKIVEALSKEPLRRKDLNDRVRVLLGDVAQPYDRLFSGWGGILKETSCLGLTVHAEPCGKEACFARLDQWLPNIHLTEADETQARNELLRKYLHCYGPASAQDFACWSGLLTSEATTLINNCATALTQVKVEEAGKLLWMLKKDLKTLLNLAMEEQAPTCLLPKYDSYLLGHKDRTRIIDNKHLQQVYRPAVGEVAAVLLTNGRIAATWTHKKTKKSLTITINPFQKLPKQTLVELMPVAESLGHFMGVEQTIVHVNT